MNCIKNEVHPRENTSKSAVFDIGTSSEKYCDLHLGG